MHLLHSLPSELFFFSTVVPSWLFSALLIPGTSSGKNLPQYTLPESLADKLGSISRTLLQLNQEFILQINFAFDPLSGSVYIFFCREIMAFNQYFGIESYIKLLYLAFILFILDAKWNYNSMGIKNIRRVYHNNNYIIFMRRNEYLFEKERLNFFSKSTCDI